LATGSVLVLGGAGDMGSGVVEELARFGVKIDIGDIDAVRARAFAESLKDTGEVGVVEVNATSRSQLMEIARRYDLVVNAVGPFYKYGYIVAESLIEAGIDGLDLCDDYDAAEKILGLSDKAEREGVTFITGLGWTPGLSNILAKMGSYELGGEVDYIDIGWFGSAADSKGLAVVMHLFYALTGDVPMYLDGRIAMVKAGASPRSFEFPTVGRLKLYYTGHPEPLTIPRYIGVSQRVTVRGCLIPQWQTGLAKLFVSLGLTSTREKIESLSKFIHRIEGVFRAGGQPLSGVKVNVGRSGREISYASVGRMRKLTTAPAALGAQMMLQGRVKERGVHPPEAIIEPRHFLENLSDMGVTATKIIAHKE